MKTNKRNYNLIRNTIYQQSFFNSLVMVPVEKASFLGSQFESKQCREQFVTPLACFLRYRCNSLAFQTPVLLHLLLILAHLGVLIIWECPQFRKMVADIIAPKLSINFRWLIRLE